MHEWAPSATSTAALVAALTVEHPEKRLGGLQAAPLVMRHALLFYALRRLGLDVAPGARPAHAQHIVLINRDEVETARVGRIET